MSRMFARRAAVMAAVVFGAPALGALIAAAPAAAEPALGITFASPPLEAQADWRGTCPLAWKPFQAGPPFVPAPEAGLTCSRYSAQLSETADGAITVRVLTLVSHSVFVPQLQGAYWSLPLVTGQWTGTARSTGSSRYIDLDVPVRSEDGRERRLRLSLDATAAPSKLPSGYAHDVWAWAPCPSIELAELWGGSCPMAASHPSEAGGFFVLYTGSRSSWPADPVGSLDGESFGPGFAEVRTATGETVCGGKGEIFYAVCPFPEDWQHGEMPTEP